MKNVEINFEGKAFNKMNDVCTKNGISYHQLLQDALGTYFWILEEIEKGNNIYSETSPTHRKELTIKYI